MTQPLHPIGVRISGSRLGFRDGLYVHQVTGRARVASEHHTLRTRLVEPISQLVQRSSPEQLRIRASTHTRARGLGIQVAAFGQLRERLRAFRAPTQPRLKAGTASGPVTECRMYGWLHALQRAHARWPRGRRMVQMYISPRLHCAHPHRASFPWSPTAAHTSKTRRSRSICSTPFAP